MFERFTSDSRRVVQRAFECAEALGHKRVGTEHLLVGLLDVDARGSSRVLLGAGLTEDAVYADIARLRGPLPGALDREDAQALQTIGIDLDLVLERIEANFGGLQAAVPRQGLFRRRRASRLSGSRPEFGPRSKQVLVLALKEALRLQHRTIGSEHILLGLIREGEGLAAQILVEQGIDLGELRRSTESTLARAA